MEKCYNSQVLNKSNKPNNLLYTIITIFIGIFLIASTYNLVYAPYHEATLVTFSIWGISFLSNVILLYINCVHDNRVYLVLITIIVISLSITTIYTSPKKPIININSKIEKHVR